ncbi:glycosyltransferase family 1 protein [Candidatus Chlorohelix sp.]|uniref:glycosyltransferase family 4 protein n=1 Tax=Candidatus Chlorohelix sp. TaxID=3139201 RepID=UPI00304FE440
MVETFMLKTSVKTSSPKNEALAIRLVGYNPNRPISGGGITNYIQQLAANLQNLESSFQLQGAEVQQLFRVYPYCRGEILHIPMIMGAQVLLTRRFTPAVVTVHDLGGLLFPSDFTNRKLLDKVIFQLALSGMRKATHILAVSFHTKMTLINHLAIPENKITVIPQGVDHAHFAPQDKAYARSQLETRFGLFFPENQPTLLYVGSELPRKNLVVLWQALNHIRKNYPKAMLLKVGKPGGAFRVRTKREIEQSHVSEAVHFLDEVADEHLPLFYSAADILIQPSLYEGFSLPTVEAMASGCPVLAARATCLPEVIGEGGIFFDPYSFEELAMLIESLYQDEWRKKLLSEYGQKQALKYDWATVANQTLGVYYKIAESNNKNHPKRRIGF